MVSSRMVRMTPPQNGVKQQMERSEKARSQMVRERRMTPPQQKKEREKRSHMVRGAAARMIGAE